MTKEMPDEMFLLPDAFDLEYEMTGACITERIGSVRYIREDSEEYVILKKNDLESKRYEHLGDSKYETENAHNKGYNQAIDDIMGG